jgi:cation diffusion facilitator family transporter
VTTDSAPGALSDEVRDRKVRQLIFAEGAVDVAVLSLKLATGLATGSLAVISDALHSLTDLANNVLALIVIRMSRQPPDAEHPYGHRKFETLAVFVLATLLTLLAFQIALGALRREPHPISSEPWTLASMGIVFALNVSISAWQWRWAERLDSDLLRADARHTFADVLTTLVVIAGWQLAARGHVWLDTACAIAVAVLVLYLAYGLFRSAIPVLVDHAALDPEAVSRAVASVPGVRAVRDVRSRYQGHAPSVDLIVTVPAGLSTEASHAISERIEEALRRRFGVYDTRVHVEPE